MSGWFAKYTDEYIPTTMIGKKQLSFSFITTIVLVI